jgi:hypothetical protein
MMLNKRRRIRLAKRRDPSVNTKRLASCEGKIRFTTYAEAKAAAEQLGSTAKAYHCQFGDHYHRGHRPE